MRWVFRWPVWSCVRVQRKRELRRRCTQRKRRKGVLRAPLTVERVMTAEAVEAPTVGRLLTVSSCTHGEKVVRGGSRLQSKTRRRSDARRAAARRPYQRKSGVRPGGETRSDSGDGGARTRAVGRRSDSEAVARLRTDDGFDASDSGVVGRCIYGVGVVRGTPGGGSALMSGPGTARERLTGETP
jgi:hypothetical protein